jgi:tRNA-binding EMAP/Myf-like protein
MIIHTAGAVVGRVSRVAAHPGGQKIWLAFVDLGNGEPVQIVFGGEREVRPGELVPVAPPGARVTVRSDTSDSETRTKKMRTRRYRGERSHGMLCSFNELGWLHDGPDEVAVLGGDLRVGESLDDVPPERYADHMFDWGQAEAAMTRPASDGRGGQRVTVHQAVDRD